jgi:peptidoglycan hydrolase-like protein with peptidoglycan-binding domain
MSDLVIRVNTLQGCAPIDFDSGGSISASVGANGRNIPDDVRTIQVLLNSVPKAKGGATPLLDVDGIVGPKTIAAIRAFQQAQLGWADGRVDPGGPTLAKLDALQGGGGLTSEVGAPLPVPQPGSAGQNRLLTAMSVVGEVRQALEKAIFNLDMAIHKTMNVPDQILPGGTSLNLLQWAETRAMILVGRHFGPWAATGAASINTLQFIRTTFNRMKIIYVKLQGIAYGDNFFAIDPQNKSAAAYIIPKIQRKEAEKRHLIIDKIYLCKQLDGKPRDQYTFVVLHELAHHVTDVKETKWPLIVDQAYAHERKYEHLSSSQRIHNAESYAAFAFESAMGNARLAALYPLLRVIELDVQIL